MSQKKIKKSSKIWLALGGVGLASAGAATGAVIAITSNISTNNDLRSQLQKTKSELEVTLDNLKTALEVNEGLIKDLNTSLTQIKEIETNINELKTKLAKTEGELATAKEQKIQDSAKIESLNGEITNLRSQIQKLQEEYNKLFTSYKNNLSIIFSNTVKSGEAALEDDKRPEYIIWQKQADDKIIEVTNDQEKDGFKKLATLNNDTVGTPEALNSTIESFMEKIGITSENASDAIINSIDNVTKKLNETIITNINAKVSQITEMKKTIDQKNFRVGDS
ncbi:hypothetical protein [[Acholeplasma] multilocale]|uniref:hypothetical protein n=1 Tax=[Acholeplasma] multilocale TaxID=264638 RepID=UPI00047DB262|nr:hypothetical protein [[Acholeplasma] multilocale]